MRCTDRLTISVAVRAAILAPLLLLPACASNPGVAPTGPDTYMVSRQAATGFTGLGSLKEDALREASAYCVAQKRSMIIVGTTESQPPYVLGNYPRAEVQFKCIEASQSK